MLTTFTFFLLIFLSPVENHWMWNLVLCTEFYTLHDRGSGSWFSRKNAIRLHYSLNAEFMFPAYSAETGSSLHIMNFGQSFPARLSDRLALPGEQAWLVGYSALFVRWNATAQHISLFHLIRQNQPQPFTVSVPLILFHHSSLSVQAGVCIKFRFLKYTGKAVII